MIADKSRKRIRRRRNKSWLQSHVGDEFVKRARSEGFRSRAAYKLMELDERYQILQPGMTVLDLGASPGGWSQYARRKVGAQGRVVAQDLIQMEPLLGVDFICGDIGDPMVLDLVKQRLAGRAVDLVISDMAPNISGDRVSDQVKAARLGERVLEVAQAVLAPHGQLLVKAFQGEGFGDVRQAMQRCFDKVLTCKPRASRARSREIYLFGKGYRPD